MTVNTDWFQEYFLTVILFSCILLQEEKYEVKKRKRKKMQEIKS